MKKIELNNYFYHGVRDENTLISILDNGILNRKDLINNNKNNFTSKDDFLTNEGTNGFDMICVSLYNTLSYMMFNYPFINLIIEKNDDIKYGSIDGEVLISNSIHNDKIIGIGIYLSKLKVKKHNYYIYNYISILKSIIDYNIDIYDLDTGLLVEKDSILKFLCYLNKPKSLNILIIGNIMSGSKDIIKEIEKKYDVIVYENKLLNSIDEVLDRYNYEKNNKDKVIIYTKSLNDCIACDIKFNKKSNYDLIIHLESMLNNYKKYYKKVPKCINEMLKFDRSNYIKWSNNSNYYRIPATKRINDKLNFVIEIFDSYLGNGGKNEKKNL